MVENPDTQEEEEELYEHFSITVDRGQEPLRIDKFLFHRLPNVSRNRVQQAAKAECVRVNNVPVKPSYKVKPLDEVSLVLPEPPRDKELKAENIPLDIRYEDEWLLVVNKRPGMVVHPGYNNYTGTLVNALVYHFEQLPDANGEQRPGLVHRIDKDTSGLLVIAKEEYAMTFLARQFFEHTVQRRYLALVWGDFEEDEGTVNAPLARSPRDRRVMDVPKDPETGKQAITHYTVLERFGFTTLVECRLETGRTHQIRAHMKHIGHPLFADEMYGGLNIVSGHSSGRYRQFVQNNFSILPRQALHARSIGFIHPKTKEPLQFEEPLPEDMQQVIDRWRNWSQQYLG